MSIADFARYPLTFGPSPVHPLRRLTEHLGGAQVWAKREDVNSALAYGGNKTRKLEYIVPDVLASGADTLVSIAGTATIVDDVAKKKELWNAGAEAWLPQGPEDAGVVLIYVDSDSAEYWDTPGGRVASVFSFVKAKATGEAYDGAEVKKLDL